MPININDQIQKNNGVIPPSIRVKEFYIVSSYFDYKSNPQRLKNALLLGPVTV